MPSGNDLIYMEITKFIRLVSIALCVNVKRFHDNISVLAAFLRAMFKMPSE